MGQTVAHDLAAKERAVEEKEIGGRQ